jgi:hypothetical protein
MTPIEQALFLDNSAHWVSAFDLSPEVLVLTLHPSQRPEVSAQARFNRPRILSADDSYAGEERNLPWDIIGFDSEQLSDGRWQFCLHTDCIEYIFESPWPEITRAA